MAARPETAVVAAAVEEIHNGLASLELPSEPATLYDPVRYILASGGKRIRPVLVLLTAEAFGGKEARQRALPAALACEVFHNFTLVHDDIMDHAATRRGRPTVHRTWDEATAILSGDVMMGLAYELLSQAGTDDLAALMRPFHTMVRRLCEGQALDLDFETRDAVSVEDYLHMIDGKTGALLELTLDLGALLGGAEAPARQALQRAGHALGRAFQIQDDLLDLTADSAAWGKTIGGDLMEGKKTYLLLRALERAEGEEQAWFARALDGLPPSDISDARARMEALGVLAEATEEVRRYTQLGNDGLAVIPKSPAGAALRDLALGLARRAV
ncbi:MAG: polyprenyl synthetase family protein [Rubricoccaceae bacterium]